MREKTLELGCGSYVVVLARFGTLSGLGNLAAEYALWFLRAALARKDNLDRLRSNWARLEWSRDLSRVSDARLIQMAEIAISNGHVPAMVIARDWVQSATLVAQVADVKKVIPRVEPPVGGPDPYDMYWFRWPGKEDYVSYKKKGGEIAVDHVNRVSNPAGSGGGMIAEAIKAGGTQRPTMLSVSKVLQKNLRRPSNLVINETMLEAVKALGGTATKVKSGILAGNHWIRIAIEYPKEMPYR